MLLGSSKSPDFNTGETSAVFHAFAKVFEQKDTFIILVIVESVTSKLSLRTRAETLSGPGALLEGKALIIFSTCSSNTVQN